MPFGPTVTELAAADLTAATLLPASKSNAENQLQLGALEGWLNTRQTFSNAAVTILATTRVLAQTGTMSAARIATLPAANALPAGTAIIVQDESGTVTTTNTISVARAGSDTINGASTSIAISGKYGQLVFISNGASDWKAGRIGPVECETYFNGTRSVIQSATSRLNFGPAASGEIVRFEYNGTEYQAALFSEFRSAVPFALRASVGFATAGDVLISKNAAGQAKLTVDDTSLAALKLGATTTVPGLQINAPPSGSEKQISIRDNTGVTELVSIGGSGTIICQANVQSLYVADVNNNIAYVTTAYDSTHAWLLTNRTSTKVPLSILLAASQSADGFQGIKSDGTLTHGLDKLFRPYFANTTPTIAAGAGAGTGPTVAVSGTDVSGLITITTGTTPPTGTVATVSFSTAYATAPKNVSITPRDAFGSNSWNRIYVDNITTTGFDIVAYTPLGASTQHKWGFKVD